MAFANVLLMSVSSFLWTEATTESTKHQKVEATCFDETSEVKKATSFEKLHEMKKEKKKEHLRQPIASQFKSEDILCPKTLFTTKHKTLKRQKKAKRQHLKTMDCGLLFFGKKCISTVE